MTTEKILISSKFGNIPAVLYTPNNKMTDLCILFLHGRGENANGEGEINKVLNSTNQAQLIAHADSLGFSVLAPQLVLPLTNWQITWLEDYTGACIDYALANLTKHPKVGLTGLSQGGGGVWRAITGAWASKIMFSVSICPTPEYGGDFSQIAKNHIPVWNFHAIDDKPPTDIQGSRIMIEAASKHYPQPPIKFDEYTTGGHPIWERVYSTEALYNWMMLQYKPIENVETIPAPTDPILWSIQTTKFASGKIETKELSF